MLLHFTEPVMFTLSLTWCWSDSGIHRLICVFVFHIWHKQVLSWCCSIIEACLQQWCLSFGHVACFCWISAFIFSVIFLFQKLMASEAKLFNTEKELECMRQQAVLNSKLKEQVGVGHIWAEARQNQQPVQPAKTQISLGIHQVWSNYSVHMKKQWVLSCQLSAHRRLIRLIWVFAGRTCDFCWFCHAAAHFIVASPGQRGHDVMWLKDCWHWCKTWFSP